MTAIAERRTYPQVITGSTWATVWEAAELAPQRRRKPLASGAPRLTNGEAVTLVMGWLDATSKPQFPLWYQYAAAAYGWDPTTGEMTALADDLYPASLSVELSKGTRELAARLDAEAIKSPRLELAYGFDDSTVRGAVAAELKDDGSIAKWRPELGAAIVKKKRRRRGASPGTGLGAVLMLGAAWLMFDGNTRPRRRR
jgi:hypothetical protein